MRLRTFLPAIPLILVAGCGGSEPRPDGASIDLEAIPLAVAVESVTLGGAEGPEEELFSAPPPLTIASDGTLLALVRPPHEIRRFDADGSFLNRIGGAGEGPGEFSFPFRFGTVGDTVWVRNLSPPFTAYFTLDGRHLSTERDTSVVVGRTGVPQAPDALLVGGGALLQEVVPFGGERGAVLTPLLLLGPRGEILDTLARIRDPGALLIPGMGFVSRRPFPIPPLFEVEPGGGAVVIADWDVRSGENAVRLRRYGPDGQSTYEERLVLPSLELGAAAEDSLVVATSDSVRAVFGRIPSAGGPNGPSLPSDLEGVVREEVMLAGPFPPIRDLVVGSDGSIWLERVTAPATTEWMILGRDGTRLFRLRLPENERLAAADRTAVWTTWTDELGVPFVRRYEVGVEAIP